MDSKDVYPRRGTRYVYRDALGYPESTVAEILGVNPSGVVLYIQPEMPDNGAQITNVVRIITVIERHRERWCVEHVCIDALLLPLGV